MEQYYDVEKYRDDIFKKFGTKFVDLKIKFKHLSEQPLRDPEMWLLFEKILWNIIDKNITPDDHDLVRYVLQSE